MKYDLHIHSSCSDGKYSKLELLRYFNENNFEVVSFADHNYIEKKNEEEINKEFFKKYSQNQKVAIIPAIEFDVEENRFLHILGYGIENIYNVKNALDDINNKNFYVIKKIIENIYRVYGIKIDIEELLLNSVDGTLSKRDITNWLIKNNYADNYIQAGYLYTSKESPCYEKKVSLTANNVIKLIKDNGGYAVLAHPFSMKYDNEELELFVKTLVEQGLDGIEINNLDKTTSKQIIFLKSLADKFRLLKTCGSDFHNEKSTPKIGLQDDESLEFIKKLRR
ncbi:MAG: PHP domain-containing protein [Bacilli bacterium]